MHSNMTRNQISKAIQSNKEKCNSLRIMLGTKENGLLARMSDKVREDKFGLMDPCMKDGGLIIRQTERED